MYRWHVSIEIIPAGKSAEDGREVEGYITAPTSKAAAIKGIEELVADDELIHYMHVGRRLALPKTAK